MLTQVNEAHQNTAACDFLTSMNAEASYASKQLFQTQVSWCDYNQSLKPTLVLALYKTETLSHICSPTCLV